MKKNFDFLFFKQKWVNVLLIFVILILGIYLLRRPVLRCFGNYLIVENTVEKADAIYILSGGPRSRGAKAAMLFNANTAKKIYCTGENKHSYLNLFDIDVTEAEMTRLALKKADIPDSVITLIEKGTSTKEEAHVIINHALANDFKKVIVVSDKFHTRRISYTFKPLFKKNNVDLYLNGAPSTSYDENVWWASENGLIMVNNEYIKLFYYWLKN